MMNTFTVKCPRCLRLFRTLRGAGSHKRFCIGVKVNDPVRGNNPSSIDNSQYENYNDDSADYNDESYSDVESDALSISDSSGYYSDDISDASGDINIISSEPSIESDVDDKYYIMQEEFVDKTYGSGAFSSSTFEDFADRVLKAKGTSQFPSSCLELYQFAEKAELSRANVTELIAIINSYDPTTKVPSNYQQIKRVVENSKANLRLLKYTVHSMAWPEDWKMETFRSGNAPDRIELRAKNVLAQIALKLVDPNIMYAWKDHVKLDTYKTFEDETGERTYGDLMTSLWAEDTENELRFRSPDGKILPISVYSDGVVMGSAKSAKAVTVLGTIGNFSDKLQNNIVGKFNLGYISTVQGVDKESVLSHLRNKCGMNISEAVKSFQFFRLKLERKFWELCLDPIRLANYSGIKLRVLGHGELSHTFHPYVSFVVGDEPAQQRMCGLYEGNGAMGCVNCEFSLNNNRLYDRARDPPRDHVAVAYACQIVESSQSTDNVESKQITKQMTKESIEFLQSVSIHPLVNILHNMPMGVNNHIFNTPLDTLHVFAAGLIKSLVLWTLTVVVQLSMCTDIKYKEVKGVLDARLHNFPYGPDLPHVPRTKFRGGLSRLCANKSAQDKNRATGSGGGFRSNHFITALLQLILCIGTSGDILPNEDNYEFKIKYKPKPTKSAQGSKKKSNKTSKQEEHGRREYAVNVKNPTQKFMNAAHSLLDVYFQCKKSEFTETQTEQLRWSIDSMCGHYLLFWELKQVLLVHEADKTLQTRKNHAVQHFPDHALRFGSLIKSDGATYESAHISQTTGVWRRTSKRVSTQTKEMTDQSVTKTMATHLSNVTLILKYGPSAIDHMGPVLEPDQTTWEQLRTIKHYRTFMGDNKKIFVAYERNTISFDTYMEHKSLKERDFSIFFNKITLNNTLPEGFRVILVRGKIL
jgi:Plavaka transposase